MENVINTSRFNSKNIEYLVVLANLGVPSVLAGLQF
jgi:hypothetical protein